MLTPHRQAKRALPLILMMFLDLTITAPLDSSTLGAS